MYFLERDPPSNTHPQMMPAVNILLLSTEKTMYGSDLQPVKKKLFNA